MPHWAHLTIVSAAPSVAEADERADAADESERVAERFEAAYQRQAM
jgi:hypothetical protein